MIDLGFAEDDLICSQWEIHCLGLLGESTGHFRTYFIYFYFVGKELATALGVQSSILTRFAQMRSRDMALRGVSTMAASFHRTVMVNDWSKYQISTH